MQTKFEQLLDYLVNEETDKANELFHEIVVEKSRQIYENLLEEEQENEDQDEAVDEAQHDEDDEPAVEENFEEESVYEIGGDPADKFVDSVKMDGEEGEEGEEEVMPFGDDEEEGDGDMEDDIYDIKSDLEELKAEIEKLVAATPGADAGDGEMKDEEDDVLKEYVDKVAAPSNTSEKSHSPVAGKNDMGGTAVKTGGGSPEAGGKVSAPKEDNAGNGNVPGGKMGIKNLSKVSGGHGAEKKGSGDSASGKTSVIGS